MADIFDKMIMGINKGVKTVESGSKLMLEKAKLNTAIGDLEKEKKQIAEQLGAQVYNLYKTGDLVHPDLESFCIQIDQKIAAIRENRSKLEALDNRQPSQESTAVCGRCGAQNPQKAKFCSHCGAAL